MAWLKDVPDEEMPDALSDIVKAQIKQNGFVLNTTRQMAYVPNVQLGAAAMSRAFTRAPQVPARLARLLNLRTGSMVGCPF